MLMLDGGMHIGLEPRFRRRRRDVLWIGGRNRVTTIGVAVLWNTWCVGFRMAPGTAAGYRAGPHRLRGLSFSRVGPDGKFQADRSRPTAGGECRRNDPVGIARGTTVDRRGHRRRMARRRAGVGEFALERPFGECGRRNSGVVLSGWRGAASAVPAESCTRGATPDRRRAIYGCDPGPGSGFLVVLRAGILVGDIRAPTRRGRRTASTPSLASLEDAIAFPRLLRPGLSIG